MAANTSSKKGAVRKKSTAAKAMTRGSPTAIDEFKNAYNVEFLGLAVEHSEADLHGALLRNLGRFLTELGRDFCFVGSEYCVQVDNQDFAVDLVFFHRGLQCLVAFELKVDKFKPADLGQLSFYVEALDRNLKKPHERPSIGVLLCATKTMRSSSTRAYDFTHACRRVSDVPATEGSPARKAP